MRRHPPSLRNVAAYAVWLLLYVGLLIGCVLCHNAALVRLGLL